eukprot:5688958-Pyramimonas_sp.AAC.1
MKSSWECGNIGCCIAIGAVVVALIQPNTVCCVPENCGSLDYAPLGHGMKFCVVLVSIVCDVK